MSKDLKEEYEHMLDSRMPDLWDRIEPQLHEKKTEKKRINRSKRIYLYSGMAAACLCLAIAIPAIIRTRDTGMKNGAGAYMMADEAASAENNGMADGAEDGGMMGESMAAQEDDASDMQGINESATMSSESVMESMNSWEDDSCDTAMAEDYDASHDIDGTMNSAEIGSSESAMSDPEADPGDRKEPQSLETVRLSGDTGEELEVEGSVLRIRGEDAYMSYVIAVSKADGQTLQGDENRIRAIATSSQTEDYKKKQTDETIHAMIRWDEELDCYRILEIL